MIIKGFPLQCPRCGAKQWIPIGNFTPPITCRGCAKTIEFPFGDRPTIDFKYRLSEQTRRVYEVDAMGHILVARFFESIFGFGSQSQLIGMHPGMSVFPAGGNIEIGEADLLMLTRRGEFIPIEVKRTAAGPTQNEVTKLDSLATAMRSPWSGVAACQYVRDADDLLSSLAIRNADGTHLRLALTYDHLLQPHPMWALSDDPFVPKELNDEEIATREKDFVTSLNTRAKEADTDWLAYSMLRRPADRTSNPPERLKRQAARRSRKVPVKGTPCGNCGWAIGGRGAVEFRKGVVRRRTRGCLPQLAPVERRVSKRVFPDC